MITSQSIIRITLLLLLWTGAQAQSLKGGAGFLYLGPGYWPGAANAVHQLSTQGEQIGSDRYMVAGGELYGRYNRWLMGVGVSALVNQRANSAVAGTYLESSASNAHLWVGWVVWQNNRLKLFPSLGPGFNSFSVNSTQMDQKTATRTIDGFSTDIALTVDWRIAGQGPDKALYAGPMLSLRTGYRFTTASAEWHGDGITSTILTPVRYSPQGLFITLGLGGGGFRAR